MARKAAARFTDEEESARLAALESYLILDTSVEPVFDNVVSLAAEIFEAPISVISLIDRDRQWSKAAFGLPISETPRHISFCARAIEQRGMFLVEDAALDPQFTDHPAVIGAPHVRFYAGAPLVTPDGFTIGALCIVDTKPRHLSTTQSRILETLARQVVLQMELRKAALIKRADDDRNLIAEKALRLAQIAGGVGLFAVDIATNVLTGTESFFRIFGLKPQASLSADMVESLILPEDAAAASSSASRRSASAIAECEYRITRPDTGEVRWIERKGEFEKNEDGSPLRWVGVVRDITEQHRARRVVEDSAAQFRIFAQTLAHHAWTATPDGSIDWFNDRVCEYSGLARSDLKANGWIGLVHADDAPGAVQHWRAALESGEGYEIEFRLRRADGAYRWHLARARPIVLTDRGITKWVGTNTDIHDQKMAEAKSAQDRDRIWNSTHDLMGTFGTDGFLKTANPAWSRLTGFTEMELLSRPLSEIMASDERAHMKSALQRLSAGESIANQEDHLVHKDGSNSLVTWSAEPLEDFFYMVARDITQQRAAEEALRQAQKMEAVGQLTGGIAHDFNNLLQGITGSLDLVRKRIMQGRVQELDRFISGAMTSASRASALTHRLLAFSRRQPLNPKPVHCNPLLISMEDLLRRTIGERIEFELVLGGGLWLTNCDANQLESAVLNLVINARDAMPDGGRLTIESCNAHLDSAYVARQQDIVPGQYVCIGVTDTGFGMSADTISKAFEPFFTTKPIGQGTGLGLSMIYGFTRQSEGYAKIYSELGKGTTVKLYLPRFHGEAAEDAALSELTEAPVAISSETVLVVEDEPVVRSLIVEVLTDLGYRVLEADDGPSGLKILQSKQRIDLLISDIGLPGLNGPQIAEAGRMIRPELKVLFMTGYAENAAVASGFLTPGMSMITKPFAMETLATRIHAMFSDG